uniref:C-C motif chemokine n=1 Tax=Sander lucioperca TaxID=283035 RepID=A0A8C9X4Y3_SANLU
HISISIYIISIYCPALITISTTFTSLRHGCCRNYMALKIPFANIKGYSVQTVTELCPINAIIFHTKKGQACTNPALHWVMDYINRLRSKAQLVHIKTSQAQE